MVNILIHFQTKRRPAYPVVLAMATGNVSVIPNTLVTIAWTLSVKMEELLPTACVFVPMVIMDSSASSVSLNSSPNYCRYV